MKMRKVRKFLVLLFSLTMAFAFTTNGAFAQSEAPGEDELGCIYEIDGIYVPSLEGVSVSQTDALLARYGLRSNYEIDGVYVPSLVGVPANEADVLLEKYGLKSLFEIDGIFYPSLTGVSSHEVDTLLERYELEQHVD